MLGLPFAVHSAGLILGGILLVVAVLAAIFGLHLLSRAARRVPVEEGYTTSYFAVASIVSFDVLFCVCVDVIKFIRLFQKQRL